MPDHERAMLAYATLARISAEKQQLDGRDRFLILAGAAACRAGWLEVAARCRELVLAHNPHHLLAGHSSFPDAVRSDEFAPFLRQLERNCGYERAEHLLREVGIEPPVADMPELDAGRAALLLLGETS